MPSRLEPKPVGCWKIRTKLEKILIVATAIAFTLIIIFAALLSKDSTHAILNTCNAPICLNDAAKIAQYIDANTNPCEDFYKFSCGNYVTRTRGDEKLSFLNQLQAKGRREILEVYREPIEENDHSSVKIAKTLFQTCMNESILLDDNIRYIKEVSRQQEDGRKLGYHFAGFLDLTTEENVLKVKIPDVFDYSSLNFNKLDFMTQTAMKFGGISRELAEMDMKDAYEFLTALQLEVHSRHNVGNYSKYTVGKYQQKYGAIDWLEFINNLTDPAIKIKKSDSVIFPHARSLKSWVDLINKTPKRTQANYLMWTVVEKVLQYLPNEYQFYNGWKKSVKLEDKCLENIHDKFVPNPVDILCDRRYLPVDKKKNVQIFADQIKSDFVEMLESAANLPEEDKSELIQKAKSVRIIIGQPENYFSDQILSNAIPYMEDNTDKTFIGLITKANRNKQSLLYATVSNSNRSLYEKWYIKDGANLPVYNLEDNILFVPTIATENFIDNETRPYYLNCGTLGTIIAVQLSILPVASYAKKFANYDDTMKCLQNSMNDFDIKLNNFLVTKLLQYSLGAQLSHRSCAKISTNQDDMSLVGLKYTPKQLYWILVASTLCEPVNQNKPVHSITSGIISGFIRRCDSDTCKMEKERILSQTDPRQNPCNDFYKFVCGNYLNNDNNKSLELIDAILQNSQSEITEMYAAPIETLDHQSVKLVKNIYKACTNISEIENDNLETLKGILHAAGGGWPMLMGTEWNETDFDWLKATYTLRKLGYEFSIFLDLNVRSDPRNATRSIFQVKIPFDLDEATDSISHRKSVIKRIALAFGVNVSNSTKDLKKLYEFTEIVTDQMLDHQGLTSYPVMTIAELQKKVGHIDWLNFINTIAGPIVQVSEEDFVIVVEENSIRSRLNLLKKTPKRTQANYMMLKVIQETLPYLTPILQDLASEDDTKEPRSTFCRQEIEKRFAVSPIDILYARKYATREKKEAIEELIERIRLIFLENLDNIQWMSGADKENVKQKAKNIEVIVGEYGHYFEDTILDKLIRDFVNNFLKNEPEVRNFLNLLTALNKNYVSLNYAKVSSTENYNLIPKKSFYFPDIYYYPELNILRVPTVQLKLQNLHKDIPNYLHYATIGKELAQEFNGLLKLSASYFDRFGNKLTGWSADTSEKYGKTSECLVKSMENFKKITFDFMLIEMQGNIGGVKLAYDTFTHFNPENEFIIQDVEYNSKQLFWISTVDCYPNNTEEYDLSNLPDTRDLPQNIAYAMVRNNPDFARDFQCKEDSLMNPTEKCQLL
ncbi:hypothetical protein FQA39_LY09391 [Lamprigera yunnana]|nr:hypothetical protein FQA39_LY09391 [Lamprigera yunnana]